MAKIAIFLFLCFPNLLFRCADNEANTGPNFSSITFFHWNLNGRTAHDSIKISLLQAHVTQYNYGIICLFESFLNSSIQTNDDRSNNLTRARHRSDSKRNGVCIHYKEHTPLIKDDIWDKVSKNGLSKICGRQPLKNLSGYGLLKDTHREKAP